MKLISISAAWVCGILLGSIFNLPPVLIFCGLLPVPFIIVFKKYRTILILISICVAVFFGAAYYYSARVTINDNVSFLVNKGYIELKGIIRNPPDVRDKATQIEIEVEEYYYDGEWQKCRGLLLLFVPRYPEYEYGDFVWLRGKVQQPVSFDTFDYRAFLAQKGIRATMTYPEIKVLETQTGILPLRWVYSLRQALSRSLSGALPEPQASLGQGIVLGINSTIPDSLKTDLSITGTTQLLVISGINLSIIAGIFVSLGVWFWGRRYSIYIWVSLLIVWLYALLTGMQAPVIRAAIMATMFLLAELLGRQKSAITALAFSAAVMVGVEPSILWSVSFQLSFLAMMGLILLAPPLQNWVQKGISAILSEDSFIFRPVMIITNSFCITFAALAAVWPLIAYYFNIVSLISPLSNLLIGPALPAIIVTGSLTAVTGLISQPAAQIIGWSAWLCLSYMLIMVYAFASIPLAYLSTGQIPKGVVWSYYVILALSISGRKYIRKMTSQILIPAKAVKTLSGRTAGHFSKIPKKWLIAPLLVLALLTSFTAATLPDSRWHISILNVNEGDAILIQYGSQDILIDGGPSPQKICQELSQKMPFWDKTIDLVILTHPHLDHLNGLVEVLQRYRVDHVLAPGLTSQVPVFKEWQDLIQTHNVKFTTAVAGQRINLAENAVLEVLSPLDTVLSQKETDLDNNGVVMKLTIKEISFLFMADTGKSIEEQLINRRADLRSTVLKVGHHGSSTSTSAGFLAAVKPQIACISVGEDNLYSLPNQVVVSRVQNTLGPAGSLYRTDKNGAIEFVTDGVEIRVKTGK